MPSFLACAIRVAALLVAALLFRMRRRSGR